jgi:hypothetical protein
MVHRASFAVHNDFRSHTGGAMSYGTGVAISISRKQKLNTKSSTEAVLVGVDDVTTMILWTKLFLESQWYYISRNVVHQDNKRAILLERNGKRSSKHIVWKRYPSYVSKCFPQSRHERPAKLRQIRTCKVRFQRMSCLTQSSQPDHRLAESLDRDWLRASLHVENKCTSRPAAPYSTLLANMR